MEPLSPRDRDRMKSNGRGVTDADIDEYEQLLVQRHWQRTNSEMLLRHRDAAAEERIQDLYRKLYDDRSPGPSSNPA